MSVILLRSWSGVCCGMPVTDSSAGAPVIDLNDPSILCCGPSKNPITRLHFKPEGTRGLACCMHASPSLLFRTAKGSRLEFSSGFNLNEPGRHSPADGVHASRK